jgi:hypothetical protein
MSEQTETAVSAADFETQIRDVPDAAKTWLRSHPEYRLAEPSSPMSRRPMPTSRAISSCAWSSTALLTR